MNDTTSVVSSKSGGSPALPDILSVLEMPSLFSRAKFLRQSQMLHHLPQVFWTVETLRPGRAVTLGGADGTAHFALCQTVERLGLGTECTLYADWPDGAVPADIAAYNDQQYQEFSALVAATPQAAAARERPGSVDLIVVDLPGFGGPDTGGSDSGGSDSGGSDSGGSDSGGSDFGGSDFDGPDSGGPDFGGSAADALGRLVAAGWLERLSDRGVLLIHRARADDLPRALYDAACFAFPHGAGLVVVGVGGTLPARLHTLFEAARQEPRAGALRHIFRRLGLGQAAEGEALGLGLAYRAAGTRAAAAEDQLTDMGLEQARLVDRIADLDREMSQSQARAADLETARAEIVQHVRQEGDLSDRLSDREAQLADLQDRLRAAETNAAKVEAARKEAEVAHEMAQEAGRQDADGLRATLGTAEAAAAADRDRIADLDRRLETVGGERDALTAIARDLGDKTDQATAARDAARTDHGAALRDLAQLAKRLADYKTWLAASEQEKTRLQDQLSAALQTGDGLRANLTLAEGARAALLQSTSWRVTRPMRYVSGRLRS